MDFKTLFLLLTSLNLNLLTEVAALYEDQVGMFDWRLEHVGDIQNAVFDVSQRSKQVVVASKENVIAALSMTAGKIVWRHVLEDSTVLHELIETPSGLITVSSNRIRKWNSQGGYLLWETALEHPLTNRGRYVLSAGGIAVVSSSKVTAYSLKTGSELYSLDAPWSGSGFEEAYVGAAEEYVYIATISKGKLTVYVVGDEIIKEKTTLDITSYTSCSVGQGVWLSCYDTGNNLVTYIDMSQSASDLKFKSLPSETKHMTAPSVQWTSEDSMIVLTGTSGTYYTLSGSQATQLVSFKGIGVVITDSNLQPLLMTLHSEPDAADGNKVLLHVKVYSTEDGSEIESYASTIPTSITAPPHKIVPYMYSKTAGSQGYRLLIIFSDHTVALAQKTGKVIWIREEGLASLSCMEMVDLPVSDVEAQMEEEFGSHTTNNVVSQFIGRLVTQLQQLSSFLFHTYTKHVTGLRVVMETDDHLEIDEDYLTRDEFSLHKMIIAVSNIGKVYGLDSFTGQVVWSRYVHELSPFKSANRLLLYIQRSTNHYPHVPYATVIGQQLCDGCGSVIYSFNPITGVPYTTQPLLVNYDIDQAMMLPTMQNDFLKPVLLLDTRKQVHVYPDDSTLDAVQEMYVFSALPDSGHIEGLRLSGNTLQSLTARPTWSISLGSRILSLKTKQYREHVHSLGKVQADRNVMYKYVNPNLVAIITEAEANTEYASLTVHLLDGVSGRILFTCEHKRSTGPVHMVHSENWIVYTFYNNKGRRTEIAVLELYEGLTQANATAFSSLHTHTNPIVMRQAYILGTSLSALSTTLTEKGISGKNILMARTVGGIVQVPKLFVDPRRPFEPSAASKEEGLPPYMPELPLSFDGTINYNQSIYRIRDIHSEPSGLESTSLVVAYGLDVFHTRVAPSNTYDRLKEDFDYLFIGGVTVGMIIISFVTRHFALKKLVKRAWK